MPASSASTVRGLTPTPTTTGSPETARPSVSNLLDRPRTPESNNACTHVELDALLGVQLAEHLSDLGAEHALEGDLRGFDERDLLTQLAGGRRDFRPDPPRTDNGDAGGASKTFSESVAAGDGPQVMDSLERGARDADLPWDGPGGEKRLVEVD